MFLSLSLRYLSFLTWDKESSTITQVTESRCADDCKPQYERLMICLAVLCIECESTCCFNYQRHAIKQDSHDKQLHAREDRIEWPLPQSTMLQHLHAALSRTEVTQSCRNSNLPRTTLSKVVGHMGAAAHFAQSWASADAAPLLPSLAPLRRLQTGRISKSRLRPCYTAGVPLVCLRNIPIVLQLMCCPWKGPGASHKQLPFLLRPMLSTSAAQVLCRRADGAQMNLAEFEYLHQLSLYFAEQLLCSCAVPDMLWELCGSSCPLCPVLGFEQALHQLFFLAANRQTVQF